MANDPYWNSVVLAMHMDDTGLTDLKGHTVTRVGNAARSSAQSKFGGYSAYFDGAGDYLTTPSSADFSVFSDDFTIEFCFYLNSTANYPHLVNVGAAETNRLGMFLSGGTLVVFVKTSTSTYGNILSSTSLQVGQWYHTAVTKTDGTWRLFVDGNVVATSSSTIIPSGAFSVCCGLQNFGGFASDYLSGYIDDLRITKGVARYIANFTVPTEAFPNTSPQLIGTVTDANSNFVARTVRSYRRSDGIVGGTTVSSASDGTFSVSAYDGSAHYVVCLDDDLDENALIFDNITPV